MSSKKEDTKELTLGYVYEKGTEIFARNREFILKMGLLLFVPMAVVRLIINFSTDINSNDINNIVNGDFSFAGEIATASILAMLVSIYSLVLGLLYIPVFIRMAQGKKLGEFGEEVRSGSSKFGSLFLAGLLYGVFVILGIFALIIPGLIIAFIFIFTLPIVADSNKSTFEAMGLSKNYVSKFSATVFLYVLAVIGFYIAASFVYRIIFDVFGTAGAIVNNAIDTAVQMLVAVYFATLYVEVAKRFKPGSSTPQD